MSEVFRERVESPQEPEIAPSEPIKDQVDDLRGNEIKAQDELSSDEKHLDVWEGLFRKKYITEFFNLGEIENEFNLKMQTATIDKFIKSELEKRSYEKNIENFEKILQEIEAEIGSNRLELFTRIKKITGYVKALNRLYKAKALKERYLISDMSSRDL